MKREELLRSKEYWMAQIQNKLYGIIEDYMKEKNINRTKLAEKLEVSKGYITQVLNGDFDHKLSKLIELSLISDKVPIIHFLDLNTFIANDKNNKLYSSSSSVFFQSVNESFGYDCINPENGGSSIDVNQPQRQLEWQK